VTGLPVGITINDGTGTTFRLFQVNVGSTVTLRGLNLPGTRLRPECTDDAL